MKATMMKVSDPIIFGHAVEAFFEPVFDKHNDIFEEIGELTKEISDMKATQPSEQPPDNSVIEVSGNETNI